MKKKLPLLWLTIAALFLVGALLLYNRLTPPVPAAWSNTYTLRRWNGDILLTAEQVKDALLSELQKETSLPPGYPKIETLVIDPHPTLEGSRLEPRKAHRLELDERGSSLLVFYRLEGECEARFWPYTLYLLPAWPWAQPQTGCSQRVLVEGSPELDEQVRAAFASLGARPYLPPGVP